MSKILATINGRDITQDNIDELLYNIPKEEVAQYATAEGQKKLLDELVSQELFFAEAKDLEIEKTDDFLKQLSIAKDKLLKSYAISSLLMNLNVTDEEAKEFYDNNADQFLNPDKVQASHILVDNSDLCEDILGKIQEGSITFSEAAKEFSSCPSKEKGGDLGFFQRGQMVKEFEDLAFNMPVGDIKTVKTNFGYHIVKLTDTQKGGTMDFNTVLPQIKKYLLSIKQNEAFNKKVNALKEKYKVEYR